MRIFATDDGCFERAAQHVSFQRTCRRNLVIQVVAGTTGAFLGKKGSFGSGDDRFKSPKQVACNAAGDTLYVADSGNNRPVTLEEDTGQITPVITERARSSTNVGAGAGATATATCNAGEVSIGPGIDTPSPVVGATCEMRRTIHP
jgi:DNA-binding beta-propeller fold protein YncE